MRSQKEIIDYITAKLPLLTETGLDVTTRGECAYYGIDEATMDQCKGWNEIYNRTNTDGLKDKEKDRLIDQLISEQQALLINILASLTIKIIGAKIWKAREDKGLKRSSVCRDTGIQMRTLIDTEEGRKTPTLHTLVKIGAKVGVSII